MLLDGVELIWNFDVVGDSGDLGWLECSESD